MSDLERFVAEENVERFRRLLKQETSPEKREILIKLLKQAEITLSAIGLPEPFTRKPRDEV